MMGSNTHWPSQGWLNWQAQSQVGRTAIYFLCSSNLCNWVIMQHLRASELLYCRMDHFKDGADQAGACTDAAFPGHAPAPHRAEQRWSTVFWQCCVPVPVGCLHPDPEGAPPLRSSLSICYTVCGRTQGPCQTGILPCKHQLGLWQKHAQRYVESPHP